MLNNPNCFCQSNDDSINRICINTGLFGRTSGIGWCYDESEY